MSGLAFAALGNAEQICIDANLPERTPNVRLEQNGRMHTASHNRAARPGASTKRVADLYHPGHAVRRHRL